MKYEESPGGSLPKLTLLMEQNKTGFTKSELKVYEYVLKNFKEVIYQSLTEISLACDIGESTVLRFCRKLGFKGYQDFKFALAQELASFNNSESDETFVDRVKNSMVETIHNTYEIVDHEELQKVIDLIIETDNVIVYAISSSGIAGLDMQNRLMRIGKHIEVITDSHMQVTRSCSVSSNTLIIAISLTGSTKDIVDAVSVAKKNNAKVVAITNYVKSPLTKFSDHLLLTSAKENPLDSGSLISKVSQLFVIDLICTGISIKIYDQAKKNKERVAEEISRKLY
ncbi:DNA-binding MurR/RpiR family transcriptional regulator [Evansella vedderi]|uniref:DNA-binding MurR/RpiR family transcriptional regulator n=1 Tax=Evansella vedderi TaxID=38282 RepID=A0ABU0A211_9BACI|nr:MurR/RpiR family transcriptional regulator [Evansella vedderi]MDQ0256390.1 DNA-binding MurR/RpiR family transcriptional regulator [Evansella vedderi]